MEANEQQPVKKRIPIIIPSHEQVQQQSRPQPPPFLFTPSSSSSSCLPPHTQHPSQNPPPPPNQPHHVTAGGPGSFMQAFAFVKETEFYTPPPPPAPAPPPAPQEPPASSLSSQGANRSFGSTSGVAKPDFAAGQARNSILVSRRQQDNPVLKHIKNVRWIFADIVPDYLLGQNTCALYLSLRYHLLHPDYIYFRIRELQKSFRLRVVLCYVDVEDVTKPLHEVTKTALLHDCSLLCAWSLEEAARYLETIKIYENKPADDIQERLDHDYLSRLTGALTTVRHVNKTNVLTLGSTFGTLAAIMGAPMEDLARCPGIGERKVKRLYDTFHEPFRRTFKHVRPSTTELPTTKSQQGNTEDQGPRKVPAKTSENSVRKALEALYAKHGAHLKVQKSGSGDGASTENIGESEIPSSVDKGSNTE